jgi:hypothetical protein
LCFHFLNYTKMLHRLTIIDLAEYIANNNKWSAF